MQNGDCRDAESEAYAHAESEADRSSKTQECVQRTGKHIDPAGVGPDPPIYPPVWISENQVFPRACLNALFYLESSQRIGRSPHAMV
ncbi:hypothetical protein GCM10007173_19240 [Glutamicibacter ardleyensis]|uniref:Uncharacterized protein n=1 Tax=Glutamicibacter ardleyensis TaxID=225894 RepID=A0ABQ2DKB5_9MICC|nr:hypothetical protein GCM10007173_19240 [Glutamicibacter ardleyensis]